MSSTGEENYWDRVTELFLQLRELPRRDWEERLRELCPDQPELQEEVLSLLDNEAQATEFLERPVLGTYFNIPDQLKQADSEEYEFILQPGTVISRYRIEKILGKGGMGVVYAARQEQPNRLVALKIMLPGITANRAIRRFRHEVETLGYLHHPGIAQIYDAGVHRTELGPLPYFAMEYIPGAVNLAEYVRKNDLTIRQKAELFIGICEAVHYGHLKGVIHRDLKPANILIDENGQPKVIDFGIARSTDSDVTVTTVHTTAGELVGTVLYMSPEQCDADPCELDSRSDVYSLGAVLYETLTGRAPYEIEGKTVYQAMQTIRESEPVPISNFDRRLRGNLEIIVQKAMHKDREKRYQSASELAGDIRRHLSGQPIEARPPTLWIKAMRKVTQHPRLSIAAASLLIPLLTFAVSFTVIHRINSQPYGIELSQDYKEVLLSSISGKIIKRWAVGEDGKFSCAEIVKRETPKGTDKFVIIGIGQTDNIHPAGFYAVDFDKPLSRARWFLGITQEDLDAVPQVKEKNPLPGKYGGARIGVFDIFPEFPGKEIVLLFGSDPECVLKIINMDADQLYFRAGQDGPLCCCYWLKKPELLILLGINSRAFWEERGVTEVKSGMQPRVLYAIKVKPFSTENNWISEDTEAPNSITAWCRCLLPPKSSDVLNFPHNALSKPYDSRYPDDRYFTLSLRIRNPDSKFPIDEGGFMELVDENGHFINDGVKWPVIGNDYKSQLLQKKPYVFPVSDYYLGELPPVINKADAAEE